MRRPLLAPPVWPACAGDGKALTAGEIALREREVGLCLGEARLGLGERGLEGPAVDGEQKIALLGDLAVLEVDLIEISGHARPHLHRFHCDEAANILVMIRNHLRDRLGHRDLRRRRRVLWLRLALVAGRERGGESDERRGKRLLHLSSLLPWSRAERAMCGYAHGATTHRRPNGPFGHAQQ